MTEAEKTSLDYAADGGLRQSGDRCEMPAASAGRQIAKPLYYFRFGKDLLLTGPVTGTEALPVDPISGFADGRAARVPVLIGSNRDECTLFVATEMIRLGETFTAEKYPRLLTETLRRQRHRGR